MSIKKQQRNSGSAVMMMMVVIISNLLSPLISWDLLLIFAHVLKKEIYASSISGHILPL
jgi:hypothetical protein